MVFKNKTNPWDRWGKKLLCSLKKEHTHKLKNTESLKRPDKICDEWQNMYFPGRKKNLDIKDILRTLFEVSISLSKWKKNNRRLQQSKCKNLLQPLETS